MRYSTRVQRDIRSAGSLRRRPGQLVAPVHRHHGGLAWYHQLILVTLMFVGRLGPVTLGAALALRHRTRLYRPPESAPIIG